MNYYFAMEANFELQNLALQLHGNNVLDDDDLFMLLDAPRPRRNQHSQLPFWRYEHFNLEEMNVQLSSGLKRMISTH